MGLFLSRLYSIFEDFSAETPSRILMLGLDGAGKCCTKFTAYVFLITEKKYIHYHNFFLFLQAFNLYDLEKPRLRMFN